MNRRQFLTFASKPKKKALRNSSLTNAQNASRFLAQATLGPTIAEINDVTTIGIESWLEQQFNEPLTQTVAYMWSEIAPVYQLEGEPLLWLPPFRWAWWQAVMRNPDLVRQRVAMALSEIMVISTRTDELEDLSLAIGSWYDMLLKHAFGNFRNLLYDVTLHPAMGFYLSHAGNLKADPSKNRFPDENFAREVMQLFSIGLFELNPDGSRKKDSQGRDIPTYDNGDIMEFAKIFTGLTYQTVDLWEEEGVDINTEEGFAATFLAFGNAAKPMQMIDNYHSQGEKRLLNGAIVPAGQSGLQDVSDAIDNLFNHPNVGPFIGRLLIQRLVTSNPSPAYISRITAVFNNNGRGVRGDMQAVIRAILLDDEARNSANINNPTFGKLREPFIRYTQLCRALELQNENGEDKFYNLGEQAADQLGQYPFAAPSVFNFFSPDFKPLGMLLDNDLTAPEFQIMTSVTANKLFNFMETAVLDNEFMEMPEGADEDEAGEIMPDISPVIMNMTPFEAIEGNIPALLDRLDLLFTYGTLSSAMRQIIETAVSTLYHQTDDWDEAVRFAILLFINNPEYAIQK